MACLKYKDPTIEFSDVPILSPPLRVIDYTAETSRLRLDLSDSPVFLNKMTQFHEFLVSTFFVHQPSFFGDQGRTYEDVQRMLYPLLEGNILSVFVHPSVNWKRDDGKCQCVGDIVNGNVIRMLVRFAGVMQLRQLLDKSRSFFQGEKALYGDLRLRIHHTVLSVWFVENYREEPEEPCLIRRTYYVEEPESPKEETRRPYKPWIAAAKKDECLIRPYYKPEGSRVYRPPASVLESEKPSDMTAIYSLALKQLQQESLILQAQIDAIRKKEEKGLNPNSKPFQSLIQPPGL